MASNIHYLNGGQSDGGGPEDPMLEQRVERLEEDVRDIKRDVSEIKVAAARIEGKLDRTPDATTMS